MTIREKMFTVIIATALVLFTVSILMFTGVYDDLIFLRKTQAGTEPVNPTAIDRLTIAAQESFKVKEKFQTVDILEEHKEYANAEKVLNNILETDSASKAKQEIQIAKEGIILRLARNSFKAGWADKAVAGYERYLAMVPEDYDVQGEFAGVLLTAGRKDDSIAQYQKLTQIEADRVQWWLSLASAATSGYDGNAEDKQKYLVIAQDALDKALSIEESPQVYNKLAQLSYWQGKPDQALEYLRKNPLPDLTKPKSCIIFAAAITSGAKHTKEEAAYLTALAGKALVMPDSSVELLGALARAMSQLKGTPLAVKLFEKAVAKYPSGQNIRLELANLLHNTGNYAQAEKHYEILFEATKVPE